MNIEFLFNLLNLLFAFGSNNWLSVGISIVLFCYNIYLKVKGQYYLSLVIDAQKENRSSGERVGMIFKIKFIVYTLVSIYALCFAILHFFDEMDDYGQYFKIFNHNTEEDSIY